MSNANGQRLLLAARKSRKGTGDSADYERQDHRAKTWAESQGHAVVHPTTDTISSQSAPWKRRELGPWMRDPDKLALYDAILISDTDRISRGTDEDFHYIEDWCYRNGKRIIVANGPQFPPREGPYGDSDRYQWIAQKRAARTYWESVRDKHADTREVIKSNQAASNGREGVIGKPPFGYRIEGTKLHKTFTLDPVTGPLALEAFQRISDGRTATSVAEFLSEQTGHNWRVKRVIDMIKRRTYLGERDGHRYTPLVSVDLWNSANTVLAGRSIKVGGRSIVHAYSGLIYCQCGAPLYRHQSVRKNKNTGIVKNTGIPHYRCAKGRRGIAGETRCEYPSIPYDAANTAVDAEMSSDLSPEWVMVTTGGDYARQAQLQRLQAEMTAAMDRKDMALVTALASKFAELDATPAEPISTTPKRTGRTIAAAWETGSLTDQRAMLGNYQTTIFLNPDGTVTAIADDNIEGA